MVAKCDLMFVVWSLALRAPPLPPLPSPPYPNSSPRLPQLSDVFADRQLLQTTRSANKARWRTLPWWTWMRGILNSAGWWKRREGQEETGRMVVEKLSQCVAKEQAQVQLPLSSGTKLFKSSRELSYLKMNVTLKLKCVWLSEGSALFKTALSEHLDESKN